MVVVGEDSRVVFLSDTYEGSAHDKWVAESEGYQLPARSALFQDKGLQGFEQAGVVILQPKKKPKGGELTPEEKAWNKAVGKVRVRVEHAICGVKRARIVKDKLRLWRDDACDMIMETCCALHNFRLKYRPWSYPPIDWDILLS